MNPRAEALGGRLLTRPFLFLAGVFAVAFLLIVWRFAAGLGPTTALSDGFPWGIWIAFDVVTGTALACGGYAVALLVYILNRGRYHPLVRPAILTSALGYTVAALSLVVDVGRPWNFWKVPTWVAHWNFDSALLEVALCIMSYIGVLWIELAPSLLEKADRPGWPLARRVGEAGARFLRRHLVWFIALGLVLPSMHQSSLGTLMILTGHKLHPLWQTPLLPLLFLISCFALGYAAVVFESSLASLFLNRRPETRLLASLSRVTAWVLLLFLAVRVTDLMARGAAGAVFVFGRPAILLWAESALLLIPAVMLLSPRGRERPAHLFRAAVLVMLGGGLYRFNAVLLAFDPGAGWRYFPSIPEMTITLGFIALEIMAYQVIVKRFPILGGAVPAGSTG
jgi:Ni/Fe-hydrogenase subunit HybB-like protein